MVTPFILPAASHAPFLRHEVAKSIPMSTENFTDILAMFMPASLEAAHDIWNTLDACEHPVLMGGERQGCATSIESMVELATAVLGTRDLHALSSSSNVPADGLQSSPRGYTVVSARTVVAGTKEGNKSMTCHGSAFPFAVFYCHSINPTRVYDVTLHPSTGGAAAEAMRVLAVCHLDTSGFDPANPFFVERGLKPGDIPLCHFLSRDTVVWMPAAAPPQAHGDGLLMASQ
ncbi:hypothetical protein HU200_015795 [Digitaria exilis]|uniref:BURP domain-containing protein n=1 Tax=Digitaria exilis TaxID=1010633 RepID=A0A835F8V7_9POAL|nr:hypothetical protein HU200_015795 [Digitaria exilis]